MPAELTTLLHVQGERFLLYCLFPQFLLALAIVSLQENMEESRNESLFQCVVSMLLCRDLFLDWISELSVVCLFFFLLSYDGCS